MVTHMNQYYEALELQKILELLAKETCNERTREAALSLRPLTDFDAVKTELDKTSAAYAMCLQYGSPAFYKFTDIRGSIKRAASGAKLSLRELMDISVVLKQIQLLSAWYRRDDAAENELSYLFAGLMPNNYLQEKIDGTIVSEDSIADSASPELMRIRRKINQSRLNLRETLDKMIKNTTIQKCLQEVIITIRDGRFVLPVKVECKGSVPGLIHDTSSSGQTIFVEPMSVVDANNDIRMLESQEQEEIERIIMELCSDCAGFSEEITGGYEICTELNLYFAKANLAAQMRACVPQLSKEHIVKLKKARHPLIDRKKVVPVDIVIGESYRALIVTGPNTGGKTVAMKTVGLLTLMTMCGLLIPAGDGSVISVFSKILVDIGDLQSIEESLSTFSAHTNKVISIIDEADEDSLILLDELGSGTDPVEGAALAVAVIERLRDYGATLMVTTHYQELKIFALEQEGVENASCEFDISTLRPTYRIIIGAPGKSNAFDISATLGMPEDIIQRARSLVGSENSRFEDVVSGLEKARSELDRQNEEIARLRLQQQQDSERIARELEAIEKRREEELEKARIMARRIIEDTKAQSNQLLDELNRIKKEKDGFSGAKAKTNRMIDEMYDRADPVVKKQDNSSYKLPRQLRKGDTVLVTDIDKKGSVMSVDGNSVLVQIGIMKSRVTVDKLRLCEEEKVVVPKKKLSVSSAVNRAARSTRTELDIRGQAADEGVYLLDSFIDDAVLSGLGMVTIIHGKGTGILRQAIHKRLRELKSVKSFRLGTFGEGEDGVTIVELK